MVEIDHVGYAVKKMEKAIDEFRLLGFEFEDTIDDFDRNIHICFGKNGEGYRVELVSPLNKEKASPVDIYLAKIGPTAYHFCYKSKNLEEDVKALEDQGFKVIIKPQKAVAFSSCSDKRVVFLHGRNTGIMEIVEE